MEENNSTPTNNHVELTVDIVSAYVSNNPVPSGELSGLIASVHQAVNSLGKSSASHVEPAEKTAPAQIKKSITPSGLISFIDGKAYKTLKRHLSTQGLTPASYREKYGLPADYPMVAASYSASRSALAKSLGLGQQRLKAEPKAAAVDETVSEAPKLRGRPRKTNKAPTAMAAE